ncbi:transcriptional regulator [Acidocella aquatica]|uniref:Transcriptional regulator n=1 Tax=Acidocella aquatica TaxID=1922313 RepID=A0ABQ6A5X8_9PROT|nr:helix-turn-helix transcriptional regulator [Acidocella aquatica]GLR67855.1 transcriptional regulator [Acidocella aquatica]
MITGTQLRMARAALKIGVREVGQLAKVSPATVTRIESDHPANVSTLEAIRNALEAAGVEFIPENGGGEGVRLRLNRSD